MYNKHEGSYVNQATSMIDFPSLLPSIPHSLPPSLNPSFSLSLLPGDVQCYHNLSWYTSGLLQDCPSIQGYLGRSWVVFPSLFFHLSLPPSLLQFFTEGDIAHNCAEVLNKKVTDLNMYVMMHVQDRKLTNIIDRNIQVSGTS